MKLQLIIQCIDTFGFKSPKDKLYFFINGNPIETIHKDNGFYSIIEKLPEKFILLIKSSVYYSYECTVNLKEKSNYLSVNLIRKIPPLHEPTVWIDTVGYTKAVLGFGYFFLADSLKNTDIFISVDNIKRLINNYDSEISVMLPAFDLNISAIIPVNEPVSLPAFIWLYDEMGKSKKIEIKN